MNRWQALDFLGEHLLPRDFRFAKTMPQFPHWYTLRKDWVDDALFVRSVELIREFGYQYEFGGRKYVGFDINGMRFWTMGAPLPATILINRASNVKPHLYDDISKTYDVLFTDPASLEENKRVMAMLNIHPGESVLDVGCGTGLLLDYHQNITYTGIDPSLGMLGKLLEKHGARSDLNVATVATHLENYYGPLVDVVACLFASASYIVPEAIHRLARFARPSGGRWVAMFAKPDYYPVTHIKTGIDVPRFSGGEKNLPGTTFEFGNFIIVAGEHHRGAP